jgi:hypothetical protein
MARNMEGLVLQPVAALKHGIQQRGGLLKIQWHICSTTHVVSMTTTLLAVRRRRAP